MIEADLTKTVGRTPMVHLTRLGRGLPARIVGKLEMRNPCGSVKDRVGVALIEDAERRGLLRPGATLVEVTATPASDWLSPRPFAATGSSSPCPRRCPRNAWRCSSTSAP